MDVTVDTIEGQLREAAENLPGPYRPEEKSWGQSFAHEALVGATPEVRAKIGEVFDRFLTSGSTNQARLAALTYPERAGALSGLIAGMERTDLPEDAREALISALGRAIQGDLLPYRTTYRDLLGPEAHRPLLFGALVFDHEWFLANLRRVLGSKPSEAAVSLWFAIQALRRAEVERLRQEISDRIEDLGPKYTSRLLKVIDDEIRQGTFEGQDGPSRF